MTPVFRFGGGERFSPALSRRAAGAGRIVGLFEFARVGQTPVRLASRGHGFLDRAAKRKRIEGHVRVWAERPANLLESVGATVGAKIRHGKERAVALAHTDRIVRRALRRHVDGRSERPSFRAPRPLNEGRLRTDGGDRERGGETRGRAASSASATLRRRLISGKGEKDETQRRGRPRPRSSGRSRKSLNAERPGAAADDSHTSSRGACLC